MGLDVSLGPASGFLDWSEEDWDTYYQDAPDLEVDKLGSYGSVRSTIETVRVNLESGSMGSRFPLFMRIAELEGGWYLTELPALLREIASIRQELSTLPLDLVVFADAVSGSGNRVHPSAEEVAELRREFVLWFPDRPLRNLADFNHHLLDTLETFAQRAVAAGKGLVLA